MTSLLNRLFGRAKKGSGATAKNRLHFVLQHDRINLPPQRMEEMKREILAVIVKYLVVDEDRVEIALEQRDRAHSKLVAEIPFAKEKQIQMELRTEATAGESPGAKSNGAGTAPIAAEEEDRSEKTSGDSKDGATVAEVDDATAPGADAEAKDKDKK
ncbi:MAG: cell division topological specificity factor MinE [Chloroflexi bacterium]|nr:cell division topological specificity factor MinE [Chloroflexota bacterium]